MNPTIFTSIINSYLPEPHASLLNGIIFGVNLKTNLLFLQQLRTVGLLHIVVLSGMNIMVLGSVMLSITSFFSKRVSILITILTIILFIWFVGPQAPIVRAGIMGILTLVAIIYGKKSYALYALILSLLFIALVWPKWISTISLQLSYGATLGIILFSKNYIVKKSQRFSNIILFIKTELRTSFAAQIFTAPIIFIQFHQVSFISPLANLMTSFLIMPLMVFGFLTAILGKIHYLFGLIPAYICYGLLSYLIHVIELFSQVPFASFQF